MQENIIIWHNPRCSKSREALAKLESLPCSYTIREYLKNPPTKKEIQQLLHLLMLPTVALIRTNEKIYKTLDIELDNEEALITAMANHPILIQRPIIFNKNKAVIGRPTDNILSLFTTSENTHHE